MEAGSGSGWREPPYTRRRTDEGSVASRRRASPALAAAAAAGTAALGLRLLPRQPGFLARPIAPAGLEPRGQVHPRQVSRCQGRLHTRARALLERRVPPSVSGGAAGGLCSLGVATVFVWRCGRRMARAPVLLNAVRTSTSSMEAGVLSVKSSSAQTGTTRSQRLKDMVYLKEVRAAITSGEFALRLRGAEELGQINYEGLCSRLYSFAAKLEVHPLDEAVLAPAESQQLCHQLNTVRADLEGRLAQLRRRGAEAFPQQEVVADHQPTTGSAAEAALPVELPDPRQLLLYLREDQTVDFDSALSGANKAAQFSKDLWERLNGHGLEKESEEKEDSNLSQELLKDPRVSAKRAVLQDAELTLKRAEQERLRILEDLAQAESTVGSDVTSRLRDQDEEVQNRKSYVLLSRIDWLLEWAALALEKDLEGASAADWDTSGRELKVFVVEFSLLDKQVDSFREMGPLVGPVVCFVQVEELAVLEKDVSDFVARVGLQQPSPAEEVDFPTSAQRWIAQAGGTVEKLQAGLMFYVSGLQLLGQDIQYAASLFSRAALASYRLKEYEVRVVQRTAKDLATLVPFIIILIIPLSPIGHVLVFSFIQKTFPDFFPSPFTERRQNIMKIYQGIAPKVEGEGASTS